jgi:hypothetical protein
MTLYFDYKGDRGVFSRWDSASNQTVTLDELKVVLLDSRSCITGWSDDNNSKIYSNLVKYLADENLSVRSKTVELVSGKYAEIKDQIEKVGGKFTTSLFVLAFIGGEWVPTVIHLHSTALFNWGEYTKAVPMPKIYQQVLTLKRSKDKMKKGKIEWYPLDVTAETVEEDVASQADKFNDDRLQPYLNRNTPEEA